MGRLIEDQKFKKVDELKKETIKYAEKNREILETPRSAFITFETEKGAELAVKSNKLLAEEEILPDQKFGQAGFAFHEASERSDIIWENQGLTRKTKIKRRTISLSIITLCMIASFALISYMAHFALATKMLYPPTDCRILDEVYGNQLEAAAYLDYRQLQKNEGKH